MDTNSSTYKYVVSVTYYLGLHNAINIYCVPHFFCHQRSNSCLDIIEQ